MTIVLKSATSGYFLELACSTENTLDFLRRQGVRPQKTDDDEYLCVVEDPYVVRTEIQKAQAR